MNKKKKEEKKIEFDSDSWHRFLSQASAKDAAIATKSKQIASLEAQLAELRRQLEASPAQASAPAAVRS